MPGIALMGWAFVAASIALVVVAVRLDRRLQEQLPPVLRTPLPPRPQSWSDDLDDDIFALMEAFPVRWRRELYPAQYRAVIDDFWYVVIFALGSVAVGGTLVSLAS